ncbi:M48 family metallopeptidase [Halosegnis marinus]|uniref:M48 family metallopeptidase n=1 Tax=Halosegnis marinus TaxID=3034023 RepID=A0ABD5ZKY3_9EURY|nr:M48 family metalloprotease [Halosegnis sp. DT85]
MERSLATRLAMVVAGLATVAFYAAGAWLAWRGLLFLWRQRPDPVTTAVVVLAVTVAFGYVSYALGQAAVLRTLGAEEVSPARAPELYRRLDELSVDLGIDRPTLCVARMEAPNALALGGPSDGVVVLDASLFRLLSAREVDGILAHELAHVKARDGLVSTLGASLVSTVAGLLGLVFLPAMLLAAGAARGLALVRGESYEAVRTATVRARVAVGSLAVVLLFALTLVLRAYSRRRELAADDTAVELTGDPAALAAALSKIERAAAASGPLSSLYIHGDERGTLTRLLATHPPMEARVERLRERADRARGRRIPIQ